MDTLVFVRYLKFIIELLLTDRLWMVQPLVRVLHVRRVALQLAVFHSRGQRASLHVAERLYISIRPFAFTSSKL